MLGRVMICLIFRAEIYYQTLNVQSISQAEKYDVTIVTTINTFSLTHHRQ